MSYILTLQLDPASQAHFNHLREQHFPPARNVIDAHVTLFHTLPEEPFIAKEIALTAASWDPFTVNVSGLRSLGKGVAYTLESSLLLTLHGRLAAAFAEHLSPQDRQKFQPHIVVQNKSTSEAARTLLRDLRACFVPRDLRGDGLTLWHYRNGPWELARSFSFSFSKTA